MELGGLGSCLLDTVQFLVLLQLSMYSIACTAA